MTYLWRIHLKLVPFLVIGLIEVGYALTSGPAMPEYTSFEPVESTDLVNLSSGEFVYTLPVMTVPGPGLGFPIVLNYHSGILQRQEATWVGLGWNLQAGAITRQVNKLPDDFKGDYIEESIKGSKVHGWAGSISYCGSSIGISWDNTNGLGGMVAASFRYEYFQMSTRIGVNGYYEGVSTSVGVGYGGENVSAGLAIGISSRDGVSINPSLGVNVEGTANFSGSASLGTSGMMGSIGLSLGAVQVSLDGSGRSSTTGSSWYSTSLASSVTGKMHNEAIQHGFDIPTQLGVFSLGLTNWSSWLQGIESNFYYGFLYSDRVGMDCAGEQKGEWNCAGWNNGGDTWKKKAEYLESLGPWEDWKARRAHGRMMATSEDAYIVSTQGVQGVFKPFRKEDGDYANVLRNGSHTSQNNACPIIPVRFCDKDHSVNRTKELTQSMDILNEQELSNDVYWRFMDDPGGAEFTNKADREATATVSRQAKQIIPFFKGSKIAGFQIVKEDGVRYNYTKALHNIHQTTWGGSFLGEYSNGDPNEIFTTQKMPTFAYTWLLTGIMGPDYAKLGPTCPEYPLCSPENGDLGQWVRFTYDAGTSGQPGETALYGWGTPYYEPEVGTIPKTEDAKFLTSNPAGVATAQKDYVALSSERSSIHGLKEIAFLRTVETPTHRADFEISTRLDGRQASVSQQIMVPGENVLVDEETDARLAKPPENGGALSQWQSHFLKEQKTIAKIATGKQPGTKVNILVKHKDFLGSLGNGFDFGPSWTKSTFVLKEVPNLTVDNSGNVSVPYTFPVYTNQPSDENGDTHKYFLKPDVLITPGPGSGPINPIPGLINLPVVTKIGILDLTSPATPRWPYQIRPECGEVDYSPTNSHLAFLKYRVTRKFKAKVPETFPIGAHVTLRANHSVFVQNSCNHNQIVTHNKDFTVNAERTVEMEFDYDNQDLVNEFQTNENGFVISTGYLYRWKAPVHFYFIIKGEAPMKKLDRIVLRNKAQGNVEVSSVEFKYDYSLVPGTPNSKADNNGKLTLASLRQGAGSQGPFLPPYTFTYHDPNARYQGPAPAENAQGVVNNRDWVPWEVQQYDRWGYRCETCSDMEHSPKEGNALAWNLKEISVPSGGKISIEYEQNRLKYLMGEDGAQPIVLPRAGTQDESEILIASGQTSLASLSLIPLENANKVIGNLGLQFRRYRLSIIPNGHKPFSGEVKLTSSYVTANGPVVSETKSYNCHPDLPISNCEKTIHVPNEDPTQPGLNPNLTNLFDDFPSQKSKALVLQCQNKMIGEIPARYEIYAIVDRPQNPIEIASGGVRVKAVSMTDPFTLRGNILRYTYADGVAPMLPAPMSDFDDSRISGRPGLEYYIGGTSHMYGFVKAQFEGQPYYSTYEFLTPKELPVRFGPMQETLDPSGNSAFYSITLNDFSGLWGSLWRKRDYNDKPAGNGMNEVVREEESRWAFNARFAELKDQTFDQIGNALQLKTNGSKVLSPMPEAGNKPYLYNDDASLNLIGYEYFGIQQKLAGHRYFWSDCEPDNNSGLTKCPQTNVASTQVVVQRMLPMREGAVSRQDGLETKTYSYYPDFRTGMPLKTLATNSDGSQMVTEAQPAYPRYTPMLNNHMLSQTYSQTQYFYPTPKANLYSPEDNTKAVASTITRWSGPNDVGAPGSGSLFYAEPFRILESRTWRNRKDGISVPFSLPLDKCGTNAQLQPYCTEGNFTNWVSGGMTLKYDRYGRPLKFRGPDGVINSQAFGYDQSLPVTFAQNTGGSAIFAESFENVDIANSFIVAPNYCCPIQSTDFAKSGDKSFKLVNNGLNSGEACFSVGALEANVPYTASVWFFDKVNSSWQPPQAGMSLFGASGCTASQHPMYYPAQWYWDYDVDFSAWPAGTFKWKQLSVNFTCPIPSPNSKVCLYASGGNNSDGSNVYYDELRVHPDGTMLSTYTYNPSGNMTSATDPRGLTRFFEYDFFGKLKGIRNDDRVLLTEKAAVRGKAGN